MGGWGVVDRRRHRYFIWHGMVGKGKGGDGR
jgi:hypothetical protein